MARIIIGSMAARHWFPDWRKPKDMDVFTPDQPRSWADLPIETFWHPAFDGYLPFRGVRYATPDELYTIKVSHAYWDLGHGSWEKHMWDLVELKHRGAVLIPELHTMLYPVWKEKHGAKQVNLTMDKEAFFSDAVVRKYDHDSVHYSVAYGDRPIYESVMADGESVQTDMAKVKALPFAEQVRLYREEIYATALERWVIPSDYRVSPGLAYGRAVKKTIVSLTKGWSSRFLVENYDVFRKPDMDYVAHHKSKAHLLIPLEG